MGWKVKWCEKCRSCHWACKKEKWLYSMINCSHPDENGCFTVAHQIWWLVIFGEINIISKILICLKSSCNFWERIVLQILWQLLIDDACACNCKWKKTQIFYIYAHVYDLILYYTKMIQLGYHSISWNPLTVSSGNLKCITSISSLCFLYLQCSSYIYCMCCRVIECICNVLFICFLLSTCHSHSSIA